MKKVYQTIAVIALSVSTIGAFAQIPSRAGFHHLSYKAMPTIVHSHSGNADRVEGGPMHVFIDYFQGDEINTGQTFYHWIPAEYMNMRYTVADTIQSPLVTAKANTNTTNYVTVCFDTLWDTYTSTYYSNVKSGSAVIDTISTFLNYHNTSGTNDTIIFQVNSVDANGFPSTIQYGADTIFANASSFTYNSFDSLQYIQISLTNPITIPATARHGWNFCINVKVYGSKLDTVGISYFSQGSSCGSFSVTNAYTSMGVPDGRAPAVNSFVTGLYWRNSIGQHGNGTQLTWPLYSGSHAGECFNAGNYYWYDQLYAGCSDTAYFPEQDMGVFATLDYVDVTGVKNVASKNFSVGQNYPNPFNKSTEIAYNVTKSSTVAFNVCDITGRELVNNNYATVTPGRHVITLQANQFTPGIYFYTFNVNGVKVTNKMIITQ